MRARRRHRRLSGEGGARRLGRHAPSDVLDISAIDELRGIDETGRPFRFGALTTWTDLIARRPAAGFRGLSGGGARGRRRAGAEPRHAGRQYLHRLAGRRRHPLPADARRGDRAGLARAAAGASPMRSSSTAIGRRSAGPTRSSPRILVPQADGGRARPVPEARRAALSGHLDRHGGGVIEADADGRIARRASRSAPARRCAQRLPALEAALHRSRRSPRPPALVEPRASRAAFARSTTSARSRRLPPRRGARRWCATCSPASPTAPRRAA